MEEINSSHSIMRVSFCPARPGPNNGDRAHRRSQRRVVVRHSFQLEVTPLHSDENHFLNRLLGVSNKNENKEWK